MICEEKNRCREREPKDGIYCEQRYYCEIFKTHAIKNSKQYNNTKTHPNTLTYIANNTPSRM